MRRVAPRHRHCFRAVAGPLCPARDPGGHTMRATCWAVGALALAGLAAPAEAVDLRDLFGRDDRYYRRDVGRIAYDEGYRDGAKDGSKDGRKGERFSLRRHGDYRDADDGYR